MRTLAIGVVLGLCACRGEERAAPRLDAGAVDAADAALDDAAVKARSRAVLEAYDRNDDDAAFASQLARSFVLFESRRIFDGDFLTRRMTKRRERHETGPSRTYVEENVHLGPTSAVYSVDSDEHFVANRGIPRTTTTAGTPWCG